ncbi:hypothetical protein [Synechococcus sp. KORDI-52]|uniref:hypothetical protein n=1 Tax=Synechococcus sp. KORDI-52 TaxID=585425 RepID=UPI0012EC34BB|nr:hypothetical protein [Synechococcus sp. KORDI-52]
MVPSWSGDGVCSWDECLKHQKKQKWPNTGQNIDTPASSATKEESRLIKALADIGQNLSLREAREKLRVGKLIRNFVFIPFVGLSAIAIFVAMIMPKAPEIAKESNKDELEN